MFVNKLAEKFASVFKRTLAGFKDSIGFFKAKKLRG